MLSALVFLVLLYANLCIFELYKSYLSIERKKICFIRVFDFLAWFFLVRIYSTLINTVSTIIDILINYKNFQYQDK